MSEHKLIVKAEPDQLDFYLERTFDAPKELVFKAYADPELVKRWWGAGTGEDIVVDKLEPKAGGSWRYIEIGKDENGNDAEYAFHGVYHSFSEDGIVMTFEFEGMPGHVLMESLKFEEHDGKTTIKSVSVFQSQADRDGMMASGMEHGAAKSYNQLEELLQKMQQE